MLISDEELDRLEGLAREEAGRIGPKDDDSVAAAYEKYREAALPVVLIELIRELRAYRRYSADKPYLRPTIERLMNDV